MTDRYAICPCQSLLWSEIDQCLTVILWSVVGIKFGAIIVAIAGFGSMVRDRHMYMYYYNTMQARNTVGRVLNA